MKDKKIHEARAFNFTYRYNEDEQEVKETTDTASSASFLTTVVNSVLKFMINGTTSILKS